MSKNRHNTPSHIPVAPVKVPGKVYSKCFTINVGKAKPSSNEVKITKKVKSDIKIKVQKGKVSKASAQVQDTVITVKYQTPYIDPDSAKLLLEANPFNWACLRFKTNCIIGAGIDITPDNPDMENYTEDAEYKKLDEFINKKPVNELNEQAVEVFRAVTLDRLFLGSGYLECVRNNGGELAELYHLPAYVTRVAYNKDSEAEKYLGRISIIQLIQGAMEGKSFKVFTEDNFKTDTNTILWIKNINPFNRYYGFADWYPATSKLVSNRSIDEYNIRMFTNDLLISFVIIVEGGELDQSQEKGVTDFLRNNYKGLANANKALYLNSDTPDVKIRIEKVNKDVREASFINTSDSNDDKICIAHGVPPTLLGSERAGKLGNTNENFQLFTFFHEVIIKPDKDLIQAKLNNVLKLGLKLEKFHIEFKELTFEKWLDMVNATIAELNSGVIDENEARKELGWKPRKDNPGSLTAQISNIGKQVRLIKSKIKNEVA